MNNLQVFNNAEFGTIRTATIDTKTYFCASDIAKALGYKRPNDAISAHCRATVKYSIPISGKIQNVNFIPEGDVYRLIIRSQLPNAEKFESWVMDEVLPSIRKNGAYMTEQTLEKALASPDFLIQLATQLKKEQEARKQAEQIIEKQKPKIELANTLLTSDSSISIGEFSKHTNSKFGMGSIKMFKWLRDNNYLMDKGHNHNVPYQRYMDLGYFETIEVPIKIGNASETIIATKTLITPKGQEYLFRKISESLDF